MIPMFFSTRNKPSRNHLLRQMKRKMMRKMMRKIKILNLVAVTTEKRKPLKRKMLLKRVTEWKKNIKKRNWMMMKMRRLSQTHSRSIL